MTKPFISLCMIVKNEENVLARCLDSVAGLIDEIIVVDTGSTDRTKQIASRYTDRIYDFEWTDSFADARNFAQSKASSEWILVLDADEYVERTNLEEVLLELKENKDSIDAWICTIYNFTGERGEHIVQHQLPRIYKNENSIRFIRSIHEQLYKYGSRLIVKNCKLNIYHSGYIKTTIMKKKKNERNKFLLKKQMESKKSAFDYFNFGNEYMSLGKIGEALEMYQEAYKKKESFQSTWVPFCVVQIVTCLIALERFQEALDVIKSAVAIWDGAPDFRYLKALVYFRQNRWDDAKEEFEAIIQNKNQFQYYIKSSDTAEYYPYYFLGKIYEIEKNYDKAVYYYSMALNRNSKSLESLYGLLNVLKKYCTTDEIKAFLEKQLQKRKFNQLEILRVLISLNEAELAEEYLKKAETKESHKSGWMAKIDLINGKTRGFIEKIKKLSLLQLCDCFKAGCVDSYDIIVASIKEQETAMLKLLYNLLKPEEREFISFVTGEKEEGNEKYYLQLMERCLQIRQWEIFEYFLSRKDIFGSKINLALGHLLYQYGFVELAITFYQQIDDVSLYDVQTFVNIIEAFLNTNEQDAALQFALLALQNNWTDFRIFKYAIEILEHKSMMEMRNKLIFTALQYYSDSRYLNLKLQYDQQPNY